MLTASLLLALTLAPADAPTPPDAAVSDAGELQGEWEIVRVSFNGNDETPLFKGDRWVFAGGPPTSLTPKAVSVGRQPFVSIRPPPRPR
jgi:hypothetical protein